MELLLNGEQIFPAQVQAIRSAQVTFTYAQYVYESGPPAQALLSAMSERCQAGVRGHVLVDGIGSLAMPAETRETLERAGCEFAIFRPLEQLLVPKEPPPGAKKTAPASSAAASKPASPKLSPSKKPVPAPTS